jgi:hypothetical protein
MNRHWSLLIIHHLRGLGNRASAKLTLGELLSPRASAKLTLGELLSPRASAKLTLGKRRQLRALGDQRIRC